MAHDLILPRAVNLLEKASEGFGIADGHQCATSLIALVDKKQTLIENAEQQLALADAMNFWLPRIFAKN